MSNIAHSAVGHTACIPPTYHLSLTTDNRPYPAFAFIAASSACFSSFCSAASSFAPSRVM